jgi:hypothetical protein
MSNDEDGRTEFRLIKLGTPATGGEIRIPLAMHWTEAQCREEIDFMLRQAWYAFQERGKLGFPEGRGK